MKTYTFKINKTNNNTISNSNNIDSLKNTIINNLARKYSWFDAPASSATTVYFGPASSGAIDSLYRSFNFDNDYAKALSILDNYGKKNYHSSDFVDEYDFEIDGTPVRIFDNMIQIGYHLIPKSAASSYYFAMKPEIKKLIIDVTIKITKTGFKF